MDLIGQGAGAVWELTATEAARRIRQGDLRAEDYARDLLAHGRRWAALNAVSWMDADRLLEQARAVDMARARGETLPPLAGLPLIPKDNIDTVGFPTSAGTRALKNNFPARHAPVVEALLRSGALIYGKGNMHELAKGGTCTNPTFGAVRNPYALDRIPGGSSGGTAAAIAAGFVPAGLGTDTAGSVRLPAAECGVAGFRPTAGIDGKAYADAGVVPLALKLDTVGPLARTVEDVALLHGAITGGAAAPAVGLAGARIGVPRAYFWEDLDAGVARVCEDALDRLRAAGAELVEIDMGGTALAAGQLFGPAMLWGMKTDLKEYLERHVNGVSLEAVLDGIASGDTLESYRQALAMNLSREEAYDMEVVRRRHLADAYAAVLRQSRLSAIAFPTLPIPAPPIRPEGDTLGDQLPLNGRMVPQGLTLIRNTRVGAVLGAPGLSIPAGLTAQGLPVGLELDGLPGEDIRLLGLGRAAEQALGRLPPPPLPQAD